MAKKKPLPIVEPPYYPIIYVRGYAGSESAVEETVATPFMGFNLGSTKVRQDWTGKTVHHVFESPLIRLMKDFEYRDVYSHGDVIAEDRPLEPRSIVIYRYYDQMSEAFGDEDRPEITTYAQGLSDLVLRVKKQVCDNAPGGCDPASFRVYLVAHSMGGLICRAFLQNPAIKTYDVNPKKLVDTKAMVDKVFTFATPHNGIELKVLGNIPSFFSFNNQSNFNRDYMREYLALGKKEPANSLGKQKPPRSLTKKQKAAWRAKAPARFDPDRFFSLVGTNAKDYTTAAGWSTRLVGESSDGLVRIDNAYVSGTPRAFVHRSHSGHYGIVNSEEGYQNLTRFLFGDVRVDGQLFVDEVTLPEVLQKEQDAGKEIKASYHIETILRPRGARFDLHRRIIDEYSAIFRTYEELRPKKGTKQKARPPRLFSVYLSKAERKIDGSGPLVFAVDLVVKVPEYEVDRSWRPDLHVKGSDLFRKTIILAANPPKRKGDAWSVNYGFNALAEDPTPSKAKRIGKADTSKTAKRSGKSVADGGLVFEIPVSSGDERPGIKGRLRLTARPWMTPRPAGA